MNLNLQELEIIHREKILELLDLDASGVVFAKLVGICKAETNARIPELIASLEKSDLEGLGFVLHRFKSTLLNLGAVRAAEVARILETEIKKEGADRGKLRSLIGTLATEAATACAMLNSELER